MQKKFLIFICILCTIAILFFVGCNNRDPYDPNDEDVAIALIHSFLGEIKETEPEKRDVDQLFQMIHYEDEQEPYQAIRKDSFQNKVIQDYKIMDVCKLNPDLYCITVDIESDLDTEENNIYVAKVKEAWKIILGAHNIPASILENLEQNDIKIPTSPLPDGTQFYPLKPANLSASAAVSCGVIA